MSQRQSLQLSISVLAVLGVLAGSAYGQTPVPTQRVSPAQPFQGPPGARALALGGAFIGVADDATAAESNPAGLTILTRPELSLHVLSQSSDPQDCPTCSTDSNVRPDFASYVQPFSRAVLSVYYSAGLDTTRFFDGSDDPEVFLQTEDQTLRRFGIAAAFRPVSMLSIGASASLNRMSSDTRLNLVFPARFTNADGSTSVGLVEYNDRLTVDDSSITYALGLLLNPTGRVSLGAVYKSAGKFDGEDALSGRACTNCTVTQLRGLTFQEFPQPNTRVETPALWGAGLSVRPFARALFALDYSTQKSRAAVYSTEEQELRAWRIGGEYVFAVGNSSYFIPVRAGYAREKDSDFNTSDFLREEATTYSVGTGFVFGSNQVDIAFSRGYTITTNERLRQVVVSGIHRF